jgi:hypothetical protein
VVHFGSFVAGILLIVATRALFAGKAA